MNGRLALECCMDNVYTLNEIVQGRFREDKNFLFRCIESV